MDAHGAKPTAEAEAIFRRWLRHLDDEFTRHNTVDRRAEIVRDELFQLFLGRPHGGKVAATLSSELGTAVVAESLDARNVVLPGEADEGLDWEQYGPRKPLIFFWQMFDRSPLGANVWLGTRFRCMVGQHVFAKVGRGVSFAEGLRFRRGYTITIEDGCCFERDALLEDREPLTVPANTVVAIGKRFGEHL